LAQEVVVLDGGKQKVEWSRRGERELVIGALTPCAGICLVCYLALICIALVEIMMKNRWHSNVVDTYKTHLLAQPARKKVAKGLWQIAAACHAISVPFLKAKTSIVDVWQYGSSIYKKLFPTLLGAPEKSADVNAVDHLGDHKKEIRVNYYGRSDALCNGNSEPDTCDFIFACHVWQSAMRAFLFDRSWLDSIVRSVLHIC
jgi:hypothetical protein